MRSNLWITNVSAVLMLLCEFSTISQAQEFPVSTSNTNVGYIDSATIANRFRIRCDAGYNMSPADRAEFFYAGGPSGTRPSDVDFQELDGYLELARNDWLSGFVEAPLRFINPELAANSSGVADINLGLKAVLWADHQSCTTFQFRTYLPTGDDNRRLGTGNVNIEPGVLQYFRVNDRWLLENEFKTWIPLTNNGFAGTVLRYGAGISYNNRRVGRDRPSVSPVLEIVGWSVLDGLATVDTGTVRSAAGDTIVNAKLGLRTNYRASQLYAGFGQALTTQHWYEQLFRIEYRVQF